MSKVKKAIIPVAGYGTRFLPFTKAVPKAMLPIVNRPAVQLVIQEAVESGIEEILLVVGQHKEIIQNHFSAAEELENLLESNQKQEFLEAVQYPQNMAKISYIVQEEQLGTGHAVLLGEKFVGGEPFAVMFGDDVMQANPPVLKQLIQEYEKSEKTVVGVQSVGYDNVVKYASVEYNQKNGRVYNAVSIVEKPKRENAKSDLAPLGRYVMHANFFEILKSIGRGYNNEYQLTDALASDLKQNGLIAYEFEGVRYDMGDLFGYLQANIEFALQNPQLCDKMKKYLDQLVKKF